MKTNYECLAKEFNECNFFTYRFNCFEFIEKNEYLKSLFDIEIEKLNNLSNLNINTISKIHKSILDEIRECDLKL